MLVYKQTFQKNKPIILKNTDPKILIELFRKYYSGCYNGDQSVAEAEAILGEKRRVGAITCEQYNIFFGSCFL